LIGELKPNGMRKRLTFFDDDSLAKTEKIKLLKKLLAQAIDQFKKVKRAKGVGFSEKIESLVKNTMNEPLIY
jgi:type I restriction enzyme R subunit